MDRADRVDTEDRADKADKVDEADKEVREAKADMEETLVLNSEPEDSALLLLEVLVDPLLEVDIPVADPVDPVLTLARDLKDLRDRKGPRRLRDHLLPVILTCRPLTTPRCLPQGQVVTETSTLSRATITKFCR